MKKKSRITKGEVRRVTSIDVAELAGVSQSTVSRAFSKSAVLSDKTREKVFRAAKELNYTPDAIARSLTSQTTNIIGIVMGSAGRPFYSKVLVEFTNRLQMKGKQTLLFNTGTEEGIDQILKRVLEYRIDALIITSSSVSSEVERISSEVGIPVILFNRITNDPLGVGLSAIACDNIKGGWDIADHLLDQGYSKFAYIGGYEDASTTIDRLKGFQSRLDQEDKVELIAKYGRFTYESGYELAKEILSQENRPQALFCANDTIAFGAIDVILHELDLRIPEDIAVVGFDGLEMADWPAYSLTTIEQPIEDMIDYSVDLLMKKIEDPAEEPVVKYFPGVLRERESTLRNDKSLLSR